MEAAGAEPQLVCDGIVFQALVSLALLQVALSQLFFVQQALPVFAVISIRDTRVALNSLCREDLLPDLLPLESVLAYVTPIAYCQKDFLKSRD